MVGQACRSKLIWKISVNENNENRDWINLCKGKYLQQTNSILRVENPPLDSSFWNGVMQAKKVITNLVSWDLGKGNQIFFWEDAWLRKKPLIRYGRFKGLAEWDLKNQGETINDYTNLKGNKWILKSPTGAKLKEDMKNLVRMIGRRNSFPNIEGTLRQNGYKNGKYNIKDGVKSLSHQQEVDPIQEKV